MVNLPGMPDNIRPSATGGYWVALHRPRHSQIFNMVDFLGNKPWLRNFVTKVCMSIIGVRFMYYNM